MECGDLSDLSPLWCGATRRATSKPRMAKPGIRCGSGGSACAHCHGLWCGRARRNELLCQALVARLPVVSRDRPDLERRPTQVNRGIAVEEVGRLQFERAGLHRQNRKVLGQAQMVKTDGVPEHHVVVDQALVVLDLPRQARFSGMLVGRVAGGTCAHACCKSADQCWLQ